jgi:hypothetical protein
VTRIVDRGAITAAYVGIGMAVTIGVSFLLVIPIEPIYWFLALPAGLLIGYYANQRSDRRKGPWSRIVLNALFAGVVTGVTMGALLLPIKGLFFFADNGYPDFNRVDAKTHQVVPPLCDSGAACVYARYLANGSGPAFAAAAVNNVDGFTRLYWGQQFSTAGTLVVLTTIGGLLGGVAYGATRPKPRALPAADGVQA